MRHLVITLLCFFISISAYAENNPPPHQPIINAQKMTSLVNKIQQTLAKKGVRVAIIARINEPKEQLPEGIKYTHTGIIFYGEINTKSQQKYSGYAILHSQQNVSNITQSQLLTEYPIDFFKYAHYPKAGIIIPSKELQKRLLKLINTPNYLSLHNLNYSNIANPFNNRFQNSSELTLNTLTAAIYETTDMDTIKSNLKAYFIPHSLDINPFTLLTDAFFSKNIQTADHDDDIQIATFSSIANFLTTYKATTEILEIKP